MVMLENAVYSILSPEGFASILWKDATRKEEAASIMKLTSYDLLDMEIIDSIVTEGTQPIELDCTHVLEEFSRILLEQITHLKQLDTTLLVANRYERFRKMGSIQSI